MIKKIVANYGELSLKGKNHSDFVKILKKNALHLLADIPCELKSMYDRLEITNFADDQTAEINYRLKRLIGISNFYNCNVFPLTDNLSQLSEYIFSMLKNKKSYKFEVSRKYKKINYSSMQIKQILAAMVKRQPDLKQINVNVVNPEITIFINVTINGFEIFDKKYLGINGLPVASSGKVLLLLSGGIDSPVAAHLLMTRGFKVDFITFSTPPYTSEKNVDKIVALIKQLTLNAKLCFQPRLFICRFSNLQKEIAHLSKKNYRIIIMRRFFLKIGEMVLNKYHYDALATGDSCGQVASQTIQSLKVISDAVSKEILVLRPLIGMQKSWIISYAKKIGTYDLSIIPIADSCSKFAPRNPITKPRLEFTKKIEEENPLLKDLLWSCFNNEIKTITGDELVNYEIGNLYTDSNTSEKI